MLLYRQGKHKSVEQIGAKCYNKNVMTHVEAQSGVPFDPEVFMTQFGEGILTDERRKIVEELARQPWFQATDPALQVELATLPDMRDGAANHDGFLADLANRPSVIGGVTVESLARLPRGNFALTPVFNVRTPGGQQYTYEYVSWRQGPLSGAKGVVFVRPEIDAEPDSFFVLVGDRFAPGGKAYESIGGFMDVGVEGVQTVTDRVLVEVKQELGVEDLVVDSVTSLGSVNTDTGMTNNRPEMFVATISAEQAGRVPATPINPDVWELEAGALRVPMSQLSEILNRSGDLFFAAAIAKSLASPDIDPAIQRALFRALAVGNVALQGMLDQSERPSA